MRRTEDEANGTVIQGPMTTTTTQPGFVPPRRRRLMHRWLRVSAPPV